LSIRDVTRPRRDRQVRAILDEIRRLGVCAEAVRNTGEAARHAATLGLIDRSALPEIFSEQQRETGKTGFASRLLRRRSGVRVG
jgi:hypothetical protein